MYSKNICEKNLKIHYIYTGIEKIKKSGKDVGDIDVSNGKGKEIVKVEFILDEENDNKGLFLKYFRNGNPISTTNGLLSCDKEEDVKAGIAAMLEGDRDTLTVKDGSQKVTVNASWLHNMCRKFALEDLRAKHEDTAGYETYADAMYENIDPETEEDLLMEAFADIRQSELRSNDDLIALSIKELSELQKQIYEAGRESNNNIDLIVELSESCLEQGYGQYEIILDGKKYADNLTAAEADKIIGAFIAGMKMSRRITVDTTAGTIVAEYNYVVEEPGIALGFIPKGFEDSEIDLALATVKETDDERPDNETAEDIYLYEFTDISTESWTKKTHFSRESIVEALGE